MQFAVVDVETTGGFAKGHRITEIGIVLVDDGQVVGTFESLVNPQRSIPPTITALTGIDDQMVENAPLFKEIAPDVAKMLEGRIFVAHNVHFDLSFVTGELKEAGIELKLDHLCTRRYARAVMPQLVSAALGRLCKTLGIKHENAHRALADAYAAQKVLSHLIEIDESNHLKRLLKGGKSMHRVPPGLVEADLSALPKGTGVYYFFDRGGKTIYVGRSKRISTRVRSHFSSDQHSWRTRKLYDAVHGVKGVETGSELLAALLEDQEIRRFWPEFNKAQKEPTFKFGVVVYKDRLGHYRLGIHKARRIPLAIRTFYRFAAARRWLMNEALHEDFNAKMCDLPVMWSGEGLDAEEHSLRVEKWLDEVKNRQDAQAQILVDRGRHAGEKVLIVLEESEPRGYRFVSASDLEKYIDQDPKDWMLPLGPGPMSRSIIEHYESKGEIKRIDLNVE